MNVCNVHPYRSREWAHKTPPLLLPYSAVNSCNVGILWLQLCGLHTLSLISTQLLSAMFIPISTLRAPFILDPGSSATISIYKSGPIDMEKGSKYHEPGRVIMYWKSLLYYEQATGKHYDNHWSGLQVRQLSKVWMVTSIAIVMLWNCDSI